MKRDRHTTESAWQTIQDEYAAREGLAVVLVDESSSELLISNNNSMCRFLYESKEFAPRCAEFCGRAAQTARAAGKAVHVKCHADLNFITAPLEAGAAESSAIVGRSFLKIEDYRKATERAISGDWQQFPATEFFADVLISGSLHEIENAAERLEKLGRRNADNLAEMFQSEAKNSVRDIDAARATEIDESAGNFEENLQSAAPSEQILPDNGKLETGIDDAEIEEIIGWRALFGSLLDSNYTEACHAVLKFLTEHYALKGAAWLEPRANRLEIIFAAGNLQNRQIQIDIAAGDAQIFAAGRETVIELRGRGQDEKSESLKIQLFPVTGGGVIRGALVASGKIADESVKRHISRFVRTLASELEILRLREKLARQASLAKAVRKFNRLLEDIDAEDFWNSVTRIPVELMRAERGSLLAFGESTQKFSVKAAIGSRADVIKQEEDETLGARVARTVFESGAPLVVGDIENAEIPPAPPEWKYKTASFISYPITIGERKIGVFNVADRIDGGVYEESDLKLLEAFAPQLAVALDRTTLKQKADEFERLSITDALTGLLNRRYLEERLTEEINRSRRHGYPLSFMMLDVDEFKSYNDRFTHPEGDKALKIVGQLMKETLRGEDVAARYGGEEFSILLPQTTVQKAHTLAERIREKIDRKEFPNRKVTVSIGIATCTPHLCTPQKLVSAADKALYRAKRTGRNNVQIFDEKAGE